MNVYPSYSQMSVAELQEKAQKAASEARKKGKKYEPVIAQTRGSQVCTSWWGKAWCDNLERYADYENRLPRGKRYVRNGALLDLKIEKGIVRAKVQGSRARPYNVTIRIDPLSDEKVKSIIDSCSRKVSSLESLAKGEFPQELSQAITEKGGLFPTPSEIHFDCSCPDWAYLCKHAACVMYGIGVKLDENPFYFFELRGIDAGSMVKKTVENKVAALLENAQKPSNRILDSSQVESLFSSDISLD